MAQGSKGWRSRESARLQPVWPGFKSRPRRHMWVEFVVGSLLCSERFFTGYSGFALSSKANISKFQFDQESGRRTATLWICYLQIINYLFIFTKPNLWSTNALLYVLVKNWKRQIISELFLIAVFLSPDFHRHRICEPRFFSGIRSRLRGLSVA